MKTDNEAAIKTARIAAATAKGKLTMAERKSAAAKDAMVAAKAAYKKARKFFKQTRKEAKAARKAVLELRELAAEAEQKWRKAQMKANQTNGAGIAKPQAASKPARSVAGATRKASFSSSRNARVITSRTSGTVEMPAEPIVVSGESGVSGGPA